jgi:hypothetical protein
MVFETSICSPLNHLTWLIARENFIILNMSLQPVELKSMKHVIIDNIMHLDKPLIK